MLDRAALKHLEIDTVDAFEGREKDIIVLSLVRANRRRDIGFLRLEQRLNVAVSRSRRLIVIVGVYVEHKRLVAVDERERAAA